MAEGDGVLQAPSHDRQRDGVTLNTGGSIHMPRRTIAIALAVLGTAMIPATSVAQRNTNTKGVMPTYDDAATVASLPMLGRWRINLDKSTNNGSRVGSDTFTWIFRAEGDKVRHDIYDVYPADKPSRSYAVKLNGSEAADPHEVGIGETISWWPINKSMFFREVKLKGQVSQRTMYSVSADGKVFTSQSWSPTKPNERGMSNLMYFDRQE
jgi:hypothetical protein